MKTKVGYNHWTSQYYMGGRDLQYFDRIWEILTNQKLNLLLIDSFSSNWTNSSSFNFDKHNSSLIDCKFTWQRTFDPSKFIMTLSADKQFDVDQWIYSWNGNVGFIVKLLIESQTFSGINEFSKLTLFFNSVTGPRVKTNL